jgi:hypothetical protein
MKKILLSLIFATVSIAPITPIMTKNIKIRSETRATIGQVICVLLGLGLVPESCLCLTALAAGACLGETNPSPARKLGAVLSVVSGITILILIERALIRGITNRTASRISNRLNEAESLVTNLGLKISINKKQIKKSQLKYLKDLLIALQNFNSSDDESKKLDMILENYHLYMKTIKEQQKA